MFKFKEGEMVYFTYQQPCGRTRVVLKQIRSVGMYGDRYWLQSKKTKRVFNHSALEHELTKVEYE